MCAVCAFWEEGEVLGESRPTGAVDDLLEDHALVPRVHALVDLVHQTEGAVGDVLQRYQIQHRRHRALLGGWIDGRTTT
jgi:predicted HAD superfamily Cof-like phosphohydrolase